MEKKKTKQLKISVIIPAYNEEDFLAPTLEALQNQTMSRSDYEIIVVDNNSSDTTTQVATQGGADMVVTETKHGTNLARQRGVDESTGEICAFCDADCIPPAHWLESIEKDLSNTRVGALSGPYDYGLPPLMQKLSSLYYVMFQYSDKILYFLFRKKSGVIIGGNFAARKETINAIGGLPPMTFWGDDALTAIMIANTVGPVLFKPEFIVKSSPRRFSREGSLTTIFRYVFVYLKTYVNYKQSVAKKQ